MKNNNNRDQTTGRFEKTLTNKKPCIQCGSDLEVGRGLCRSCYNQFSYNRSKESGRYSNGKYIKNKEERDKKVHISYRNRLLKRSYGISFEEFERMNELQGGLCAICQRPERSSKANYLSVDHCHETGKVRGLLCMGCNMAIGLFEEQSSRLSSAIKYLAQFGGEF